MVAISLMTSRGIGLRLGTILLGAIVMAFALMGGTGGAAYQRPGSTSRVSVASDGTEARASGGLNSANTISGEISANGRVVVFASVADNLVARDTNLARDIFLHDLRTERTKRVSISSDGTEGVPEVDPELCDTSNYGAERPSVSANGRFTAFDSCFPNLVLGDTNRTWDVFVHDRRSGKTERVSLSSDGAEGDAPSVVPAISGNGRFVTFLSDADNLVKGDRNGLRDVFVHDRRSGKTERVSLRSDGSEASGPTGGTTGNCPSIDFNGRHVAFSSSEALVEDDTNAALDVYVRDLKKDKTERVSVATEGGQSSDGSTLCWSGSYTGRRISATGRYVTYWSLGRDLVPNDGNAFHDVFLHDRATGRTERLSVDAYGQPGDHASRLSAISPNGRYIVFESFNRFTPQDSDLAAGYLVDAVQGGDLDVFIHDRATGATEMMSIDSSGKEARNCRAIDEGNPLNGIVGRLGSDPNAPISTSSSVSANGRLVAFISCADNLVADDSNMAFDAFVRDRGVDLGAGGMGAEPKEPPLPVPLPLPSPLPTPGDGHQEPQGTTVPGAGRGMTSIEVDDSEGDAVGLGGDQAGYDLLAGRVAYRPDLDDLFVTIEVSKLAVLSAQRTDNPDPRPGVVYALRFAADGVSYELRATAGGLGLFLCRPGGPCVEKRSVRGGYGTTGERVVAAIPLSDVGLEPGDDIDRIRFLSGRGTYATGILQRVDRAPNR